MKSKLQCETCVVAKCTRLPFGESKEKLKHPLDIIHSDVSGITRIPTSENYNYFVNFIDGYSRFAIVHLLKSREEVFDKFKEFQALVENKHDRKIKKFHLDNGTKYLSNEFIQHLKTCGIEHPKTAIKTPQQNGIAERYNRTLKKGARAVLLDSKLSTRYWPYAVMYMAHIKNRVPHSAIQFRTPFELWHKGRANYNDFRPFGCPVVICDKTTNPNRNTYSPTGIKGRFLGYSVDKRACIVLRSDNNTVTDSRDIITLNGVPVDEPQSINFVTEILDLFDTNADNFGENVAPPPAAIADNNVNTPASEVEQQQSSVETTSTPEYVYLSDKEVPLYLQQNPDSSLTKSGTKPRKIVQGRGRPTQAWRYRINCITPNEVEDALKGQQGQMWRSAMESEYNSLTSNQTWTIVPRTPSMKPVKPKWVLKLKLDEDVPRFKARLVARGFTQRAGVDYFDTFSPVIRISSVRLLFSYALSMRMDVHHIDVKNAYLNAHLDETIFMDQPDYFHVSDPKQFVCKLNRSLYGLKQSAKCWNNYLKKILSALGLKPFNCEPCIFATENRNVIVGAYVDDLLVASSRPEAVNEFVQRLSGKIKITHKGPVKNFLGINICADSAGISLDQSAHISRLLTDLNLTECNGVATSMPPGTIVEPCGENEFTSTTAYQQIVGSLLHIANFTRPDIGFAVGQLCRFMSAPRAIHTDLAYRVLKYLKRTQSAKLTYTRTDNSVNIYTDANYGNGAETKSTSGGLVFVCGNLVNWWSQRQQIVATSTMEAKIAAIKTAAQEASYLRQLLYELNPERFTNPFKFSATTNHPSSLSTMAAILDALKTTLSVSTTYVLV